MSFFAANAVPITTAWSGAASFPSGGSWFHWPVKKLDAFSIGTDAVFQVLEEPGGWENDQSQEGLLPQGFNSVTFETPIVAIRFRVWPGTLLAQSGQVHIKLLG